MEGGFGMIDHVQPGQTIKAATINSIIDGMAIGSNTLDVRQTDKGT